MAAVPWPYFARPCSGTGLHVYQRYSYTAGAGSALRLCSLFGYCAAAGDVRLRGLCRHGQIPAARRGNRTMNELPLSISIPTAALLVISGIFSLLGSFGPLR